MSDSSIDLTDPDEPIGATLARLRRASGLTGMEVGRRAGISQPKVSRIETGTLHPSPRDVAKFARALGADDEVIRQLIDRSVMAQHRTTDWTPSPISLASTQRDIAEREAEVAVIRAFEPAIVHGLLQTGEYARALLSVFQIQEAVVPGQRRSSTVSIAEALAARISRQEVLVDTRRRFQFVIMEAALNNSFCPPEDMLGQIRRIREISHQLNNVSVKIVPESAKLPIPPLHGFELFDDDRVTIDTFNTSLTSHSKADVHLYRQVFDSFEAQATEEIDRIVAKLQIHYANQLAPHEEG